jgi:hypothetical protein
MAKAMEKAGVRRLGTTTQPRGKVKTRSSVPPKSAAKVMKVVPVEKSSEKPSEKPSEKKERATSRPPAAAILPVPRVEPVRLHGSEHGAAVSRTDHLKARFSALSAATSQIKALKRAIQKNFFDIGQHLDAIREGKLYEVKGYGSFESFVEREMDLDKVTCMRLARVARSMVREAALEVGMERACAAMAALDGDPPAPSGSGTYPVTGTALTTLPAHKR